MKIIKYEKLKKNKYKLFFDDGKTLTLFEDVILKNELLLKSDITTLNITKYKNDNYLYEGYYFLFNKLKYKLLTENECFNILKEKDYNVEQSKKIINLLLKINVINDDIYTKLFIEQKIISGKLGPAGIKNYLVKKGIRGTIFIKYLSEYSTEIEMKHINNYLGRFLKGNKDSKIMFDRKSHLKLIKKGFTNSQIQSCLSELIVDDSLFIIKEALRFKKKYSSRGDQVFYLVKNALYKKGYSSASITFAIDKIKNQ